MKAFIGEPADRQGNAIPCVRCDRRSTGRVGGEPRCDWHMTETLPAHTRRGMEASRRDRRRGEAQS